MNVCVEKPFHRRLHHVNPANNPLLPPSRHRQINPLGNQHPQSRRLQLPQRPQPREIGFDFGATQRVEAGVDCGEGGGEACREGYSPEEIAVEDGGAEGPEGEVCVGVSEVYAGTLKGCVAELEEAVWRGCNQKRARSTGSSVVLWTRKRKRHVGFDKTSSQ